MAGPVSISSVQPIASSPQEQSVSPSSSTSKSKYREEFEKTQQEMERLTQERERLSARMRDPNVSEQERKQYKDLVRKIGTYMHDLPELCKALINKPTDSASLQESPSFDPNLNRLESVLSKGEREKEEKIKEEVVAKRLLAQYVSFRRLFDSSISSSKISITQAKQSIDNCASASRKKHADIKITQFCNTLLEKVKETETKINLLDRYLKSRRAHSLKQLINSFARTSQNFPLAFEHFTNLLKWMTKQVGELQRLLTALQALTSHTSYISSLSLKTLTTQSSSMLPTCEMIKSVNHVCDTHAKIWLKMMMEIAEYLSKWSDYVTITEIEKIERSEEIDQSLFIEPVVVQKPVNIKADDRESEEDDKLSASAPPISEPSDAQSAPSLPCTIRATPLSESLEKLDSKIDAIRKEETAVSLIDFLSEPMLIIRQSLQKEFMSQHTDVTSEKQKVIREILDHLFLMTQGIELFATAIYGQRFDLLESCLQAYSLDLHIAVEQYLSLRVMSKTGKHPTDHRLDILEAQSGLSLKPEQVDFLQSHSRTLLWVRYLANHMHDFQQKAKALPKSSGWLHALSTQQDREKIRSILKEVMETYQTSLYIVLGEKATPLMTRIDQLLPLLDKSLNRSVNSIVNTTQQDVHLLEEAQKVVESFVRGVEGREELRLSLKEMEHYLRWMIGGRRLRAFVDHPSLGYWHTRSELNIEKVLRHFLAAESIHRGMWNPRWHKLAPYIDDLEGVGYSVSAAEKEILNEINMGISHHYLHIKDSSLSKKCRQILKDSQSKVSGFSSASPHMRTKEQSAISKLVEKVIELWLPRIKTAKFE